jgi:imidazolonepropionase-like amidohydrolase
MRTVKSLLTSVLAGALFLAATSVAAQQETPIVLRGGRLLTVSKGVIENGVLIMQGGKITAVGAAGQVSIPRGAQVIDVSGMTVYPGLIDSETRLGLTEISQVDMTQDLVEPSDNITPHMRVHDAFHAESELIPVTRMNGITNVIVAPDLRNTLPGQSAFIQLAGGSAREMILTREVAMNLNFTGAQRRPVSFAPGGTGRFPSTRMGVAAQLRQAMLDAQHYQRTLADFERRRSERKEGEGGEGGGEARAPKRDLKLEALLPYLDGKKTVVVAAEEPSDIQVAIGLAQEFNLKMVLSRLTYAHPILDEVAALGVPVIVGSIYRFPKEHQRYDAVFRLPAELHKRGVKIAFATWDGHNVRNLPYAAGYAVAHGLPWEAALRAITLTPAEIWGVADQLGSLEAGKTANVVVANGDPLDLKTDVVRVFIQGREVPLESRQTRLRDEYMRQHGLAPAKR